MPATIKLMTNAVSEGRTSRSAPAHGPTEHVQIGLGFPPTGERIRRLREACTVIKKLWTEDVADFEGHYYRLAGAIAEPKPLQRPHPPFWIGGDGEKLTLRVVAEHADVWNAIGRNPTGQPGGGIPELTHKLAVLDRHCADVGREPASIRRSVQVPLMRDGDLEGTMRRIEELIGVGFTDMLLLVPRRTLCPDSSWRSERSCRTSAGRRSQSLLRDAVLPGFRPHWVARLPPRSFSRIAMASTIRCTAPRAMPRASQSGPCSISPRSCPSGSRDFAVRCWATFNIASASCTRESASSCSRLATGSVAGPSTFGAGSAELPESASFARLGTSCSVGPSGRRAAVSMALPPGAVTRSAAATRDRSIGTRRKSISSGKLLSGTVVSQPSVVT
jgi:Luciferase-like monooxygenase